MKYKIFIIEPRTPFHIGIKEGNLEKSLHYVPSDTLFSAFCNVYRLVYGRDELENLLEKFLRDNPPFILSSAFPCVDGKPLFPMPKSTNQKKLKILDEEQKILKRIEFVDETIFRKILTGEDIEIKRENIIQDRVISTITGKDQIWIEVDRPRVTIDRKASSSEIFYFGETVFLDSLHFLIDVRDKNIENRVETVFRVLGDEGIGGDRSCGRGLFSVVKLDEIEFNEVETEWYVTLSMIYPREGEIEHLKGGYFELVERGGWVYSPEEKQKRKKFVRMIKEGSVFKGKVIGKMVEIARIKYPIYRYGFGLTLPIRVES